ncbi:MAG: type IV pili methyl-accepting chemotaxis transducer N-terminal domain-containing protein, partial [Chromatiales bacterium]|nr:type IV pili methyl-accepting chemotaxis transducer N-terminal domain-containing protein [Chromatiales bacterium]
MKMISLPLILSLLLSTPLLLSSTEAVAKISSISDAINKSGRQRMLTQRILSSYYQVGKMISPTKSKKQLKDAIQQFSA